LKRKQKAEHCDHFLEKCHFANCLEQDVSVALHELAFLMHLMSLCIQLLTSNWRHCEAQQKKIVPNSFVRKKTSDTIPIFGACELLFAVQHGFFVTQIPNNFDFICVIMNFGIWFPLCEH